MTSIDQLQDFFPCLFLGLSRRGGGEKFFKITSQRNQVGAHVWETPHPPRFGPIHFPYTKGINCRFNTGGGRGAKASDPLFF